MQIPEITTQSIQSEEQVDLAFLFLETRINDYWFPRRGIFIKVRDIGQDVVWIGVTSDGEIKQPTAIYVRSANTLFRTEERSMRWQKTKNAFNEIITNVKIIE